MWDSPRVLHFISWILFIYLFINVFDLFLCILGDSTDILTTLKHKTVLFVFSIKSDFWEKNCHTHASTNSLTRLALFSLAMQQQYRLRSPSPHSKSTLCSPSRSNIGPLSRVSSTLLPLSSPPPPTKKKIYSQRCSLIPSPQFAVVSSPTAAVIDLLW